MESASPASTLDRMMVLYRFGIITGFILILGWVVRPLFAGYLSTSQISGLYVSTKDHVTQSLRVNSDGTYEQELKVGDTIYRTHDVYTLNTGANVVFHRFYVLSPGPGNSLNPPKQESVVSTKWDAPGKLAFGVENPNWDENNPATGPFKATYTLTRLESRPPLHRSDQ